MSSWNWSGRALVAGMVMMAPAVVYGQSLQPTAGQNVSADHRPWVGLSLGTGFVGSDNVEPDDSRDLAVSVDIPLQPIARIRVGAGRMGVNGAEVGAFPLKRLTFDGVLLRPFVGPGRACQSHFVVGGGLGLYHYGLDNDASEVRRGYQLFSGAECVGGRTSFSLQLTGRSIRGPANLHLPDAKVFAFDMHIAFRLRL
jgi:hypothetical protein